MSFRKFLKEKEINYISTKYEEKVVKDKEQELLKIKEKLENTNILTEELFEEIRRNAIDYGGFMNHEIRKCFYQVILSGNIKSNNQNQFCYFDIEKNEFIFDDFTKNENHTNGGIYEEELEADFQRSNLFKFFENELDSETLSEIKSNAKKYTQNFFFLNKDKYEYYQGFQEIALYFYFIEVMNADDSKSSPDQMLLQRTAEFYFYNFINKLHKINFDSILVILSDLIEILDKSVNKQLLEITKTKPYYAFSWIITWFSHKNSDLFLQLRIFDYLICSPPTTILYLSAIIIIHEFSNFVTKHSINSDAEEDEDYSYFTSRNWISVR